VGRTGLAPVTSWLSGDICTVKYIDLGHGRSAAVDDADYDRLSVHKWWAMKIRNVWYACRSFRENGKKRWRSMHREVLGLTTNDRVSVDHRDGNGLNNSRDNIRICTHAQNSWNVKNRGVGQSGVRGVRFEPRGHGWRVQIQTNGKRRSVGTFRTREEASAAYEAAIVAERGEFATAR
jgi:hypothetical protein